MQLQRFLSLSIYPLFFNYIFIGIHYGYPQFRLIIFIMDRSLYLSDIPGTKPAKRIYDKSLIRARHEEEISRHGKKQLKLAQWYVPTRKPHYYPNPEEQTQWRINKVLTKSTFPRQQKSTNSLGNSKKQNQSKIQKRSILSGSGKNVVSSSVDKNPYFPHRYVTDEYGEKYKWTGNREWKEEPKPMINLPSSKEVYFQRWN